MQRRIFLGIVGTAITLGSGGCISTDRETVPQGETFVHDDIEYQISGRTSTEEITVGSSILMPREDQILINIDVFQENTTENPVQINTSGEIETPEGDTFDPVKQVIGSEEIPPGRWVLNSMGFSVPNEYEGWKFILETGILFGTSYEVLISKSD